MALRRGFGGLALAALCALMACNDKGDAKDHAKGGKKSPPDLVARCEQVARACGDGKHLEKLLGQCKDVGRQQLKATCIDPAAAVYDCYQKELCGTGDQVWSLDDLRVLAERHGKCIAERDALRTCTEE